MKAGCAQDLLAVYYSKEKNLFPVSSLAPGKGDYKGNSSLLLPQVRYIQVWSNQLFLSLSIVLACQERDTE